jgi:hypothetical protein
MSQALRARLRRFLVGVVAPAAVACLGTLLGSSEAAACPETPVAVQPLLPMAGASHVPRNAVLIAFSNAGQPLLELRRVDDAAGADAGVPVVKGCQDVILDRTQSSGGM